MKSSLCGAQLVLCMLNFCFIDGAPAGNQASSSRDPTAYYKGKFEIFNAIPKENKEHRIREVQKELRSKGLKFSPFQVETAILRKDQHGNWVPTEDQYMDLMNRADTFIRNDMDNDKLLTLEELRTAIIECGQEWSEEADQMIKGTCSAIGDRINFFDFTQMLDMMEYHLMCVAAAGRFESAEGHIAEAQAAEAQAAEAQAADAEAAEAEAADNEATENNCDYYYDHDYNFGDSSDDDDGSVYTTHN